MADAAPHIMWLMDADGSTRLVNLKGSAYTGIPVGGLDHLNWLEILHPNDRISAQSSFDSLARTQTPLFFDCRILGCDGLYRWHALRSHPVLDESGAVARWIGTATDIDENKVSAARLRKAERTTAETVALVHTLQSHAPIGLGFVDQDLRQVGQPLGALPPDGLRAACQDVLASGEPVLDTVIDGPAPADPTRQGQWLASYYPVRLEGRVVGVGIIAVDIHERHRSEQAHRQLAAIVNGSGEAIVGVTIDGVVTSWNAAAERLFGYTAGEIVGGSVARVVPPGCLAEQVEMRAAVVASGSVQRRETRRRRKDGSEVDVLVTFSPVTDDAAQVTGISVIIQDITERIATQQALQASRNQLDQAQRIAQLGSFALDLLTGEMTWSAELYRILGLDPSARPTDELFFSVVHPDDRDALLRLQADLLEHGKPGEIDHRVVRANGSQRWVYLRAEAELAADGSPIRLTGALQDETDRRQAEQGRRAADARFEIAFDQAGIGAAILDLQGIPRRLNAAACVILGRPEDELIDRSWAEFNHPDELPLEQLLMPWLATGHDSYAEQRRLLRPDGTFLWSAVHITLVRGETGEPQYFMAQLQDITERKVMEQELAHQALHDSLTGLPNRALLTDRLVQGLAGTRLRGTQLGVLFVNVDHFKQVNDQFGHTMGDQLLAEAAARLMAMIRPSDTVARFGGDEFVIVCDDVSVAQAQHIAERVLTALNQPYQLGGQRVQRTASLGIVVADQQANPETLLRDADAAMHLAKTGGGGRVELFDEVLRARAEWRMSTESGLRRALENGEFTVRYQPIIDVSTGTMVSAEALIRWEHPDRGMIGPGDFIPLAEQSGLIVPIGAWVLEQACRSLAGWQHRMPSLTVAVNLSVRQMVDADIVNLVADVLGRTGIDPAALCLELTESVFMEDAAYFGRTLAGLRTLGVTLAIDDFGTGYSSLSYLKRFPVNAVKVDKAFVDGLGSDPHDSALVAAIVAMADALGLIVTAEGVEDAEQLAILKKLQCQRVQGFHLARPMPAAEMNRLVAESHRWLID